MLKKSVLIVLPARDFNEAGFLSLKNKIESRGVKIFIASDSTGLCIGNSGLKIKADINFYNIHENNFSALIFSGGNGAREYWNNALLHRTAQKFFDQRKVVAAICSAPVILAKAGLLNKLTATCFPDDKKELERSGAEYKDLPVVIRKKIITARDEHSAEEFAQAILDTL